MNTKKTKRLTIHNTYKLKELLKDTYTIEELHSDWIYTFTIKNKQTGTYLIIHIHRVIKATRHKLPILEIHLWNADTGAELWNGRINPTGCTLRMMETLIGQWGDRDYTIV